MKTTEFQDKDEGEIQKARKVDKEIQDIKRKLEARKKSNERNSVGAMPMKGRPLMVPRKDLVTKRRRDTNHSYRQTSRTPTSGTWRNGENHRTH